jgi:hypothetical protein
MLEIQTWSSNSIYGDKHRVTQYRFNGKQFQSTLKKLRDYKAETS